MIIVRGFLALIFLVLVGLVLMDIFNGPKPNYRVQLPVLAISIGIVLVLGPLWPSANKIQKVKAFFDRLTGLPNSTPVIANVICACYATYKIWDTYAHSPSSFAGFERTLARTFGPESVPVGWFFIAVGAVWYGIRFYKASKETLKNSESK